MSKFQKKGQRESHKKLAKQIKADLDKFNTTLLAMNDAYYALLDVEDLTEENFLENLKRVSAFKFNDKHIEMLKKDLL